MKHSNGHNWRAYHSPLLGEPTVAVRLVKLNEESKGLGVRLCLHSLYRVK